jgi:hypothetical protein
MDKLSNVIGAPFPDFVLRQFANRAYRNSTGTTKLGDRTNDEVLFLANKMAWVRLISSVDLVLPDGTTLDKFITDLGIQGSGTFTGTTITAATNYTTSNSLAKNWILQAGTSVQNGNGIDLRSGLGPNGAYGLGGTQELGYRPMPGLTSVTIETTGRLGSLRQATINFKVWNMNQLNTIEALYFRLGYSMLLEWGHVQYYRNQNTTAVEVPGGEFVSKDIYGIDDPFNSNLRKEDIQRKITIKRESTSGNYDGMLGVVTNFTWSFNQDGGYDCVLKLVGLGSIMDSMRVNQNYKLPAGTIRQFRGAENAIDAFVAQQFALLRKQIADLEARGGPGGGVVQPVGTLPTKLSELQAKLVEFDGFDNTRGLAGLTDTYGVPSFVNIQSGTNGFDFFGVFRQGAQQTRVDEAQRKFGGLYLVDKKGGSGLTYIPNPTGTGITTVTLNEQVLRYFAASVRGVDYDQGSLGPRQGQTTPTNKTLIYSLDFAKVNANTTQIAGLIGYLTGIKTEILPANYGRALKTQYTYVQADELVAPQYNVMGATNTYKDEIKVSLDLPYGTNNTDKNVYLTIGYEILSTNNDFRLSRKEFIDAISIWSKNPTMDLTSLTFSKNSKDITITGKVDLTVRSLYKGPPVDPALLLIGDVYIVSINNGTNVAALNVPVTLTLKTNNPGFISGVAKVTTPPPAGGGGGGGGNTGTGNTAVQKAVSDQIESSMGFSSALHAMLTVVQTFSQADAIAGARQKQRITHLDLTSFTTDFYKDGIFKDVIGTQKAINPVQTGFDLTAFAQKGFASELMVNYEKFANIPYIGGSTDPAQAILDLPKKFLKSFTIKFKQNNIDGLMYPSQFPVYISLGYLLGFLNNMCLFYDSKSEQSNTNQTGGNDNRPYVYIDFNPETNFCLTSPQQFSIDPIVCLIPANLTNEQYLELFPPGITPKNPWTPGGDKNGSKTIKGENAISQYLNDQGFTFQEGVAYRGKTMNILLTTQYLLRTLRDFTTADPEHAVNLHPFLERIMTDVNKCLGGMNLFRVAYRDDTNTIQIQDDQFVPALKGEPTTVERTEFINNLKAKALQAGELPIFGTILSAPDGKTVDVPSLGMAREMQFKTVMSTKMASMIAISAQAYTGSINAKDHSELSYLNRNYRDRFKPYVKDQTNGQTGTNTNTTPAAGKNQTNTKTSAPESNDQKAADRFNEHVKSIYKTADLVAEKIDSMKGYYIERISKVKSGDKYTSAAPFIPAELELTLDGIGGIVMGNAFTIPKERLPLSLKDSVDGFPKVGFIVNGLTHTIESNQWLTKVKGQMIKLREQSTLGNTVAVLTGPQTGLAAVNTGIATGTGVVGGGAGDGGGVGTTNKDRKDPNSPCYVPPFVLQPGRTDKFPAAGKRRVGMLAWRAAFPGTQAKGMKALIEAQTRREGFYPAADGEKASLSWRTNNPGNIGTTESGGLGKFDTLTEGIQRQIDYINEVIAGDNRNYPPDPTLYEYISIYAPPCTRVPPEKKLYVKSKINNPISYTNGVIAYVKGEYGIDITADMRLSQIVAIR